MLARKLLDFQGAPYRLACSFALLLGVTYGSLNAQDDEALKKRFLDEAPRAWEALNAHVFQLQGRIKVDMKWGTTSSSVNQEIKGIADNQLSEIDITRPSSQTNTYSVHASNPDYIFTLNLIEGAQRVVSTGSQ